MKKKLFYLGVSFFLFGAFLIFDFQAKISGNAIADIPGKIGSFLGLIFFVVGIALIIAGREVEGIGEGRFEKKVIETPKFKRSTRNADERELNRAIAKLGTGLGGEHPLSGLDQDLWAINTSKGGRLVARRKVEGNIVTYELQEYLPSHKSREYRYS